MAESAGDEADEGAAVAATERWFLRRGIPHFIEDYSAGEDVFTRALPVLALVLLAQLVGAVNLDWPWWANTGALVGANAVVVRVTDRVAAPDEAWNSEAPDPGTSAAPYRIYNIGNNQPVELMRFIGIIEECLGRTAEKNFLPMQAGDVPATYADVDDLARDTLVSLTQEAGLGPHDP